MFFLSRKREIIFGITVLFLFALRYYFSLPPENIPADRYINKEIILRGVIVSEPDKRDNFSRYVIKPSDEGKEFQSSKILITADRFPQFDYGDLVEVKGEIDFPESFENELGREFDYPKYLAKDSIRYVSFRPEMSIVEKGHGSKILSFLFSVKNKFVENIEKGLTEPHSSLASGITLGLKQSLGNELLDTFRTAGIIHIVVLSGYNMTIILAAVMYALGRFPKINRGVSLALGAILTLVFAALVGFSATVLRAMLMALLAILARFLGRPVLALRTLFIAGLAMLFWNPLILFYDPSFQLSFLATFGLIAVSPLVEKKLTFLSRISRNSSKWKQIFREIITATIATQIFVLPALIYMTGQFSIVSLPVNLLLLPLVPWAMLFTGVLGLIGFVPLVGKIAAIPGFVVLEFIIKVSLLSSKIPLSAVTIKSIPLWLVFLVYAFYSWFMWKERQNFLSEKT